MRKLITKTQLKLASWLYNQGIVAPQILDSNSVIVLPNGYSEKDLSFYSEKQQEIKNHIVGQEIFKKFFSQNLNMKHKSSIGYNGWVYEKVCFQNLSNYH